MSVKNRYKRHLLSLCVAFAISGCTSGGETTTSNPENVLTLGADASEDAISIRLSNPINLNSIAFESVLAIRASELTSAHKLLSAKYTPSGRVFGAVDPKAAWVSFAGYYYVGAVPSAYVGYSMESTPLLNPMLLLAADFVGSSIHTPNKILWKQKDVSSEWAVDPNFPFAPYPVSIQFLPKAKQLLIEYDLTSYTARLNAYIAQPITPAPTTVSFSAYNARDLGFRSVAILPDRSSNIGAVEEAGKPSAINDIVGHWKEWFGSPEGYNHRSKTLKNLSDIPISTLSASISIGLWRAIPEDIKEAEPDLIVVVTIN